MHAFWTMARLERLRKLAGEGLSSRQIAKAMGTTKGAVIGKAGRSGIAFKHSPPTMRPKQKPRMKRIWAIAYQDEEIARGTCLEDLCIDVRDMLNREQPPGERLWTKDGVRRMARQVQ